MIVLSRAAEYREIANPGFPTRTLRAIAELNGPPLIPSEPLARSSLSTIVLPVPPPPTKIAATAAPLERKLLRATRVPARGVAEIPPRSLPTTVLSVISLSRAPE